MSCACNICLFAHSQSAPWLWLLVPWNLFRGALARVGPRQRQAVLLLAGTGFAYFAFRVGQLILLERRLSRAAKSKRQVCLNERAALGQALVARQMSGLRMRETVMRLPVTELRRRLAAGELSPPDVLAAFQSQALLAHMHCNCLTEVLLTAEEEAARLANLEPSARDQLPLFGLPVSIKEHFAVKDLDCTFGNPSYCAAPRDTDAAVVRLLRELGAVPFCRTNMAQMGLAIDCNNALFGETVNPLDDQRSPGGSSGGEGALVASFGSPLGFGSDIGGSIRIPAAFCGVCGFKPTPDRVSTLDCPPLLDAQSFVVSLSIGPLAQDVDGLELGCRALFSERMARLDPFCPTLPFCAVPPPPNGFKIGFYITLKGADALRAVPAVQRAVMIAKEALEARGHVVVPWSPPHLDSLQELCLNCYFSDGGFGLRRACLRELVTLDLALCSALFGLPASLRRLLAFLLRPVSPLLSSTVYASTGCGSIYRLWRFYESIGAFAARFAAMWQRSELDAVICPTLPIVAPPLRHSVFLAAAIPYCVIYNLLGFPAGVMPVSQVTAEDIERLEREYPVDDLLLRAIRAGQRGSVGLPVGVQCVALKWQDERCLAVMKEIEVGLQQVAAEEPEAAQSM